MSNGKIFEEMEVFGNTRIDWLCKFLELPNGIPDKDTFRRVFERLNPGELLKYLNEWLEFERESGGVIAIDGKTICGSADDSHRSYHVVSAWVSEKQFTLGQIKTEEKSNEITAIPELLDLIDIEGGVVTIDAGGCHKKIAAKIVEKKADYVLALKGNQATLHEDAKLYFESDLERETYAAPPEYGHGRIEKREYFLTSNIDWLPQKPEWANLRAIGAVRSAVEQAKTGERYSETRYYITSLTDIKAFAHAVRSHWSIESQLHWQLDVSFGEDSCRAKKDNSPLNLNVLRKVALPLLRNADFGRKRQSIASKMYLCSLDSRCLEIALKK
jgi:predicted transposase YbfD/YdcC